MAKYSKLIAAVLGLFVIIVGPEVLDLTDDAQRWMQSILALLTAVGVYQVPNKI